MTLLFSQKKTNAVAVLTALVRRLNIPISNSTLNHDLQEHPHYPSLMSISDCLTQWNVPHQAFKIAKTDDIIEQLSFPFIAHLNLNGGQFILVKEIVNNNIYYSDELEKNAILSEVEFLKFWDRVVLYAERGEASGEINYKNMVLKGWLEQASMPFLLIVLFICILCVINYDTASSSYLALLGIKLTGIGISVLLLMHSIGANNPLIQNLCSLSKKNNCNAILKSDAAKVTSWLSWSEVGFFYFTGGFLSLLLMPSSLNLLTWLNILALPYTFYSIYYQYKHKNLCVLCCTVQGLLWFEALNFALRTSFTFSIDTLNFSSLSILAFLIPVAIWVLLKPFFLKAAQAQPLKKQLKKFKYNSDLFNQLLTSQPRYTVSDELKPIVLGNPNAETVITMVSNPFCGPCITAHQMLDKWLIERDDLQLKIIFTTANYDNDKTKVVRHLTALNLQQNKKIVEQAINDWYEQSNKKYETWAAKFPISFNEELNQVSEKQKQWCDSTEIAFTPTILINGYKLIEPYKLEDIKYLIN